MAAPSVRSLISTTMTTRDFKTGFALGGGTSYRMKFNRYFYDVDLQLRYPLHDGMTPYLFVGGGAITVQRDTLRARASFTNGAGKLGAGMSYQLRDSDVALYVEGTGWIYKWDRYGYDNVQFDMTLSAGISYRFKF
jgi:hypothetical protein